MKRFFLFALVATVFVACSTDATQDLAPEIPTSPDELYVSFDEEDSRVQLSEAGEPVWTKGDCVSVFNRSNANDKYKFAGVTGDTSGTLKLEEAGTPTVQTTRIVAVYPYNANYWFNWETYEVKAYMAKNQTYFKDSFGRGSSIMVASSNYQRLSFKNVCGWLKLQFTGSHTVTKITLTGNNNEQVAGDIYINTTDASCKLPSQMDSDEDPIENDNETRGGATRVGASLDENIFTDVSLDCSKEANEGVALDPKTPTAFYIALPPQTFSNGISITVTCADGLTMKKSTSNPIAIQRNHILPMASIEVKKETPEEPQEPDTPAQPTPPADEIWYTSTDGKIVEPYFDDEFGATLLSNTYKEGKGVMKFNGNVTKVGEYAFKECKALTSLTIPDSVTTIGYNAFAWCDALKSINIPNSVTSIGDYAFYICKALKSVTIGNSVTSIGKETFYQCSALESVTIGNSVTSIGEEAFYWCSALKSITIPNSVTEIGDWAFYYCEALESITIPNSVTKIGKRAFGYCSGAIFINCNIPSASDSSNRVFCGSKFTSVIIGDSVTSIGSYAFWGCTALESVTIGNSVTEIGTCAFDGCSALKSVTIGNSVTEIGIQAFYGCSALTNITIPNNVTSIGYYAFGCCYALESVNIGNSVTEIGERAFWSCSALTSITIPNSVTEIGYQAFSYCEALKSVTIGNSVTSIREWAFAHCEALTSVTIPDSVTSIGYAAFVCCSALKSVTIGNSVTSIGKEAFYNCEALKKVRCKATTPPTGGSGMFSYDDNGYKKPIGCTIYVPTASVYAYKTASVWSNYASSIEPYNFTE